MAFIPKLDQNLLVDLPGERVLAPVRKIVTNNLVIVELTSLPLAKSHTYKLRELVPVRRTQGMLGETWEAVSQHELRQAEQAASRKAVKAPVKKKGAQRAARSR